LPGLNTRHDADLPSATKVQSRAVRIKVPVEFFKKERIHVVEQGFAAVGIGSSGEQVSHYGREIKMQSSYMP
jgi:hypothetical protein